MSLWLFTVKLISLYLARSVLIFWFFNALLEALNSSCRTRNAIQSYER